MAEKRVGMVTFEVVESGVMLGELVESKFSKEEEVLGVGELMVCTESQFKKLLLLFWTG